MATYSRSERLLNLIAYLHKTGEPVTFDDVGRMVDGYRDAETARRTVLRRFERDLEALASLGLYVHSIESDAPGVPEYALMRRESHLPFLTFTAEELLLLGVVERHFPLDPAGASGKALRSALVKLRLAHPLDEAPPPPAPAPARGSPRGLTERLDRLLTAISEQQVTKFKHHGERGVAERELEPYGLGRHHGNWYVVGRDRDRRAMRTFNVSRITSAVRLAGRPRAYEIPEDFDLRDHVGVAPWELGDGGRQRVRVRVDKEVAFLLERHFYRKVEEQEHSVVLETEALSLGPLFGFLAPFGRRVRVLAPEPVARSYLAYLGKVLEKHAPTQTPKHRSEDSP